MKSLCTIGRIDGKEVQAPASGFADADVTVNGNGTWRYPNLGGPAAPTSPQSGATSAAPAAQTSYFYGGDDADNASFPVFQELAIEAASPEDEVTAVTGRVFVAQSPESFTYDADGNMLTDGRFRYTWNAENRLVRAQELVAPTNRHPSTPNSSTPQLFFPAYDANGNISEYVSEGGEVVAHYDYSPFGETLIESGDLASTFTHRFSTKPWCPVTGLYEYQMRKYRPGIGRWLSRDPLKDEAYEKYDEWVKKGKPGADSKDKRGKDKRGNDKRRGKDSDNGDEAECENPEMGDEEAQDHFADEDANGQDFSSDNQDDNQAGTGSRNALLVLIFLLLGVIGGVGTGAPSNSPNPGYSF